MMLRFALGAEATVNNALIRAIVGFQLICIREGAVQDPTSHVDRPLVLGRKPVAPSVPPTSRGFSKDDV